MNPLITTGRFSTPITTGTIKPHSQPKTNEKELNGENSFAEILSRQLSQHTNVQFSKHAVNRVVQRNIDVSDENMKRLDEGVRLAQDKGLSSPLILVGTTAYEENISNNRVITTLSGDDLKGNVFTNIDGTVII